MLTYITVHYILTIFSGLSGLYFEIHYGNKFTVKYLGMIANVSMISVFDETLSVFHSLSFGPVNQDWFYLSGTTVPDHLGSPEQRAVK